jgi:hypothetical protein
MRIRVSCISKIFCDWHYHSYKDLLDFYPRFSLWFRAMKRYFNQLLRVNLFRQKSTVGPISGSILRTYLGGKGLGSYLLVRKNSPHIGPFSPQDRLIFTLGPVVETFFMPQGVTLCWGNPRRRVTILNPILEGRSASRSVARVTEPSSLRENRSIGYLLRSMAKTWRSTLLEGSGGELWGGREPSGKILRE